MDYNKEHNITPMTVKKSIGEIMDQTKVADSKKDATTYYIEPDHASLAADPVMEYMSKEEIEKQIKQTQKSMEKAAKDLDFIEAARFRDELTDLKRMLTKAK